jgi:CheY-like chemotaxis protein
MGLAIPVMHYVGMAAVCYVPAPLNPSQRVQAVEAVAKGTEDLILMDCEMPVMDGFEAVHRIRQSIHREIPVVALTASATVEDCGHCLSRGMNEYLSKPVDLWQLSAILDKYHPIANK